MTMGGRSPSSSWSEGVKWATPSSLRPHTIEEMAPAEHPYGILVRQPSQATLLGMGLLCLFSTIILDRRRCRLRIRFWFCKHDYWKARRTDAGD